MRHAKATLGTALLTTLAVACASLQDNAAFNEKGAGPNAEGTSTSGGRGDGTAGGVAAPALGSPAATGVVIAHSATFPSFRLCFKNYPTSLPQPDSKVMPGANVVGVEVGGAVRIDALSSAPGLVYVIDETRIRAQSGAEDARTCGDLIAEIAPENEPVSGALVKNKDYYVASELTQPLGVGKVDVLAITGCADDSTVAGLEGVTDTDLVVAGSPYVARCGDGWKPSSGNLKAEPFALTPNGQGPTDTEIPVAVFNASAAAAALGAKIEVRFGAQADGGARAPLPVSSEPFRSGGDTRLPVDQTREASYGELGFEVVSTVGARTDTRRQTLADVQQLSAPGDVPTTYYRAASNYALLVLGDPSHTEEAPVAATAFTFNPRRALHIVAVPVLDPTKLDAGTDAAAEGDAGVR